MQKILDKFFLIITVDNFQWSNLCDKSHWTLEIFLHGINIINRRSRLKMTESNYIWTIKCQFKVVVRQKLNPSLNNLFLDIILRHFNKMAHENVNILLLNYAHNKVKTHSNPKKDNKQSSEKFFEYY